MSGWGQSFWGGAPWGAGDETTGLQLIFAVAIRENVLQATFNRAVYFSRILTPTDASNPERCAIVPIAGTTGLDGQAPRQIRPVLVEQSAPSVLLITTDRPMSPWNAQYLLSFNGIVSTDGQLINPSAASYRVPGLYRMLRRPSVEAPSPSHDIANPQTYLAQLDPLPQAGDARVLGVMAVGSDGDYARDEGLVQLRKRIIRRLITAPGAFASLPGYGVGVPTYGKRLLVAGVRQRLAAEAERQIAMEPEVESVRVTVFGDPTHPGLTIFRILVRTVGGQSDDFNVPFAPV